MKLRDLPDDWRQWLTERGWYTDLDPELPVYRYEWDDDVDGDQWRDRPHLAVKDATGPIPHTLAWPVHVDGWADATSLGWAGIDRLTAEGKRQD